MRKVEFNEMRNVEAGGIIASAVKIGVALKVADLVGDTFKTFFKFAGFAGAFGVITGIGSSFGSFISGGTGSASEAPFAKILTWLNNVTAL